MGAKRTRFQGECDDRKEFSVPPGFESLTSFTLQKVENNEEACNSVAVGNESEQGPIQVASTSTIISTGKLKSSVRRRPWILDDHVDHMEEDFECEADKGSSSRAYLPKGVIRGCSSCHNCQKVIARSCPELARIPSLDEAPVLHPTEEEFKDTLKYVASILPLVKQYGVCRIVPPSSWKPPCRIEEEDTRCGVDTHIQHISDLQSLFLKKRLKGAHKKTNNRWQKIPSMKPEFGHSVELKEFGCCNEHFEFECGPKFKLKSFKNYADHFKRQYFAKEDQITASNFNSDAMQMLSEPSIPDIEGEYWRIIENPTEEIEVLHGNITETSASQSGFPLKTNPRDVTACPQYVESGWNLNNTPKLQDSLLRFESCNSSSILLPRLSFGMCFSSNHWRIEEHHLYLLYYIHFGAPRIFYGVPGGHRCKFEEAVKKHLPQLSAHPCLLHNLATQFSPSILTSEGTPVYRCVQNPKEFVLILPGAYHAEFDSGFNCYETVNFAPFDWLPHGQNAVELYREQDRKTSISHDKLLLEAATEAIRASGELAVHNKNSFDDSKWRTVCRNYGYLTKALKTRVATEVRTRKYLFASLESRKMEDDFCATTKRECVTCFCDLYLSAIGCKCSPHKYTCLLHAKQLCDCAWSERYLLIRYEIDELNIMVEDLDRKVSAVYNWAKEKLGLPVSNVSKDASKEVGMETMKHKPVIPNVQLSESISHRSTSRQASDIQQYRKVDVFFAPSVGPSSTTMNLNHRSQLKENVHDENKVLLPKVSQNTVVGENIATSSSTVLKKHLAQGSSSTVRNVIILSDDED
ncbi:putative lysine-specific demethylase JMJ16 isoform X1 [Solanum stenotomum]|uniref:putative lysine-specific demethylase JMJ16 isoform X1 n=1 Tax=Solanum stenotomum TaxID=172797 RepID=UPI0020D0AC1E|nr:putative lysine-specific demethylase JMJ16 isoform X1 [Solanum stenotomum]XP_049409635.1 putative lysine-specific demethylase JMJ16 isoform X1 [Solanum stenotomum]